MTGLFRHLLHCQRLIWDAVNSSSSFSSDGFYDAFVKILTSYLKLCSDPEKGQAGSGGDSPTVGSFGTAP